MLIYKGFHFFSYETIVLIFIKTRVENVLSNRMFGHACMADKLEDVF